MADLEAVVAGADAGVYTADEQCSRQIVCLRRPVRREIERADRPERGRGGVEHRRGIGRSGGGDDP